jgi:hypothetical protein
MRHIWQEQRLNARAVLRTQRPEGGSVKGARLLDTKPRDAPCHVCTSRGYLGLCTCLVRVCCAAQDQRDLPLVPLPGLHLACPFYRNPPLLGPAACGIGLWMCCATSAVA